jgi:hypothetical protein
MKRLLNCTNCKKYHWQHCGDMKVVAIFLGLQQGYMKFCCSLCPRDISAKISLTRRGTGHPDSHWSWEERKYSTYHW